MADPSKIPKKTSAGLELNHVFFDYNSLLIRPRTELPVTNDHAVNPHHKYDKINVGGRGRMCLLPTQK